MDTNEAVTLLEEQLGRFRLQSYEALANRIDAEPVTMETPGHAAASYQIEFIFLWDDKPGGNVRVMGSVDDGGWRSFVPVTRSFIKAADGTFVGE
jgi:hypothetical protein